MAGQERAEAEILWEQVAGGTEYVDCLLWLHGHLSKRGM
jgi:hypothetical protein